MENSKEFLKKLIDLGLYKDKGRIETGIQDFIKGFTSDMKQKQNDLFKTNVKGQE